MILDNKTDDTRLPLSSSAIVPQKGEESLDDDGRPSVALRAMEGKLIAVDDCVSSTQV
jgi:hypothetical protein